VDHENYKIILLRQILGYFLVLVPYPLWWISGVLNYCCCCCHCHHCFFMKMQSGCVLNDKYIESENVTSL